MIYKAFQDLQLSQLGFGTMRLPLREDKSIDEELAAAMTDAAIRQGVNYFDTACPITPASRRLSSGRFCRIIRGRASIWRTSSPAIRSRLHMMWRISSNGS